MKRAVLSTGLNCVLALLFGALGGAMFSGATHQSNSGVVRDKDFPNASRVGSLVADVVTTKTLYVEDNDRRLRIRLTPGWIEMKDEAGHPCVSLTQWDNGIAAVKVRKFASGGQTSQEAMMTTMGAGSAALAVKDDKGLTWTTWPGFKP